MTQPDELLPLERIGPAATANQVSVGLDAVAALGVATGVGWGLWPVLGPFAIAIAGVLLGLIVYLSDMARELRPEQQALPDVDAPAPGPSRVHVSGG